MDNKGGLQLIPDTKHKVDIKRPGENRFLFIGGLIMSVLLLIGLGTNFYENYFRDKIEVVDQEFVMLEQGRNKDVEEKLKTFYKQSRILVNLIGNHIFWSQGLGKLESRIKNEVQINSLNANAAGNIDISGKAKSYIVLARQLASLISEESIEDVTLGKVKPTPNGEIEFSMTIKFNVNKFLKNNLSN